jgi:hypothetical protein
MTLVAGLAAPCRLALGLEPLAIIIGLRRNSLIIQAPKLS